MRQAFLRWKWLHGEIDLNTCNYQLNQGHVKAWFSRYFKENYDYYKIGSEYRIKISDKELLELEKPKRNY